jgi:hypothetical protein
MFHTLFYSHGTRFSAYHDSLAEAREWLRAMAFAKAKPLSVLDKIVVRHGNRRTDYYEYL